MVVYSKFARNMSSVQTRTTFVYRTHTLQSSLQHPFLCVQGGIHRSTGIHGCISGNSPHACNEVMVQIVCGHTLFVITPLLHFGVEIVLGVYSRMRLYSES